MGTFHHDRGELHGITVVVDTQSGAAWVGRCDVADERGVLLLDADIAAPDQEREPFLRRAAAVGVWPRHRRVLIARRDVVSIRRLAEVGAADSGG